MIGSIKSGKMKHNRFGLNLSEANIILHEAMGFCWHEWVLSKCQKCLKLQSEYKQAPTRAYYVANWSNYGIVLEWAIKQEWWWDFKYWALEQAFAVLESDIDSIVFDCFNGPHAIAAFIKEQRKNNEA